MIENTRHLFDIPDDVHYFNCAYMSPLLKSAKQAAIAGIQAKAQPWRLSSEDFFTHSNRARELFAGLIHAHTQDIAIAPSVSYGTAIAAQNIALDEGDKVLVLAEEFPSNLYAWRVKAKAQGASVMTVQRPVDNDWTLGVLEALQDASIKIVALPQTHWIDGGQLDLLRISAMRLHHDFALVIDLTQSLGVVGVDVGAIQPDFLICASYKWLLGPYSFSFIYVHPKHQAGAPLEYGWLNRPGAEDFSRLIDYVDEINTDATRFDMGERANFHLTPIAISALEQIHQWGQSNIESTLSAYTGTLCRRLEALGFIAGDEARRSPHYLGVQHPNGLPDDLLTQLASEQLYLSKRGDTLRISPHLYNDENDADCLVTALSRVVGA